MGASSIIAGLAKGTLIITITMAVVGVTIHEFAPQYLVYVNSPTIRELTMSMHRMIKDVYKGNTIPMTETVPESKTSKKKKKDRLMTVDELAKYDGSEGSKGLYLAVLGKIFNVKKGKQHYGPGGGYGFFAGRDGSRAFVSGDFTEAGLIDDITGLTSQDYIGLDDWVKFYQKDYKYVGKLIGRYYNEKGEETVNNKFVQKWIAEAYDQKEQENGEKKIFPPCNSEWSAANGARVWCTTRSGGVEREWQGVPRKLIKAGQPKPRCACVKPYGPPSHDPTRTNHNNRGDLDNPNLQEYPGCIPDQPTCVVPDD